MKTADITFPLWTHKTSFLLNRLLNKQRVIFIEISNIHGSLFNLQDYDRKINASSLTTRVKPLQLADFCEQLDDDIVNHLLHKTALHLKLPWF